jgi:hypothetical protein
MTAKVVAGLAGKKTYINSALMVLIGLYMLMYGEAPTYANAGVGGADTAIMMILNGLGLSTLRAGVSKTNGK